MAKTKKKQTEEEEFDYSGEAGAGLNDIKPSDLGVPFLQIAQALSPVCIKSKGEYVEGMRPGMIYNSITHEILGGEDESFAFVPAKIVKLNVEWKPKRGGWVAAHKDDACLAEAVAQEKGGYIMPNGNIIMPTVYVFGTIVDDNPMPYVIAFSSTGLKHSRKWFTLLKQIRMKDKAGNPFVPPIYSHKWDLSTQAESNAEGNWYGWKITNGGPNTSRPVLEAARSVNQAQNLLGPITSGVAPGEALGEPDDDLPI